MYLSKEEENKNRIVSGGISLGIIGLLFLFLIYYNLITPNPPFPEGGTEGGGMEMALGMDLGNDNIEFGSVGKITNVVAEQPQINDVPVTEKGDVPVEEKKIEEKKNTTLIKPVKNETQKVKELTEAEKAIEKFKKNSGKNGGGIGDNDQAGQNGSPDGTPGAKGNGGNGNGDGGGNGNDKGPGNGGKGNGGRYGVDLKGRSVLQPPKLPSDTKEEGKVVVEITVDSQGNVIEANPNGRGTTTTSALLKAKAKQAALATKFNVDGRFEEQQGTITIVFSFD
ncbi:MAG: hypothetical protein JSU07_11975 [Bacteroidetes bacterium]|nr:hypothetical protein [Bacteroidota bacterium]